MISIFNLLLKRCINCIYLKKIYIEAESILLLMKNNKENIKFVDDELVKLNN